MLRWRLASAAVIIALLFTLMVLDFQQAAGALPGMWLVPWMALVVALATGEVLAMLGNKGLRPMAWPVYVGSLATMVSFAWPIWLRWSKWLDPAQEAILMGVAWPAVTFIFSLVLILVVEMGRFDKPGQHIVHIALGCFTVAYLGLLGGFMVALRLVGDNAAGMTELVSMVFVVKMSDVGAYAFGRLMGANKLVPRLSPGKTIEGAIGGIATACVASWAFFRFIAPVWEPTLASGGPTWTATMIYGAVLALFGMIGDLAESLLKRDTERKDSSTWLPGLGGVLDIIDSLLIAGPAAYLCWQLGLLA
jgi:phosphatidate cytidylyltransferase